MPGKRKLNPISMLGGLFNAQASSSKYTQLSDFEDSSLPPNYGRWYLFPSHRRQSVTVSLSLNVSVGRLTGSTLRGAIAAVCGTAFLVSSFLPLIGSLCNDLLVRATTCVFSIHEDRIYRTCFASLTEFATTDCFTISFLAMIKVCSGPSSAYHPFAPTLTTPAPSSKASSPPSTTSAVS